MMNRSAVITVGLAAAGLYLAYVWNKQQSATLTAILSTVGHAGSPGNINNQGAPGAPPTTLPSIPFVQGTGSEELVIPEIPLPDVPAAGQDIIFGGL